MNPKAAIANLGDNQSAARQFHEQMCGTRGLLQWPPRTGPPRISTAGWKRGISAENRAFVGIVPFPIVRFLS